LRKPHQITKEKNEMWTNLSSSKGPHVVLGIRRKTLYIKINKKGKDGTHPQEMQGN
jgi:hypothetical protein